MKLISASFALILCCCAIACGGSTSGNYRCLSPATQGADQGCIVYSSVASENLSSSEALCTQSGNTIVSSCPTDNLLGCCTTVLPTFTEEACYYGTTGAATYETACTQASGNWSTRI